MILTKPIYVVFSKNDTLVMTDEKKAKKMVEEGQYEDAFNGRKDSDWWLLEIKPEDIEEENSSMYVVTSKSQGSGVMWGDSLYIEGIFSTEEKAKKHIEQCIERDSQPHDFDDEKFNYTVTEMTVDLPFGDEERQKYPSAWYFE